MKKNYFPLVNEFCNVFFAVEEENQAREGKIVAQHVERIYNPDTDDANEWRIELTIECEDGKTYKVNAERCYKTIEDYRANIRIELCDRHIGLLGINGDTYYTIELGQVVKHIADIKAVDVTLDNGRFCYTSPDLPSDTRIFMRDDVAEQMCRTEWTDENGNKHVRDGLLSLVMLNDEQKAAINALKDAYKHCEEIGIGIGFSTAECELYAWNKNNVKSATIEYDDYEDESVARWMAREVCKDFATGICPKYVGDEDYLCVIRKDEDEQQAE